MLDAPALVRTFQNYAEFEFLGTRLLIPELGSMVCDDFSDSADVPVLVQHFLDGAFDDLLGSSVVTFNACKYFST